MDKLILFDIDGTLLTTGGCARRAFGRALAAVYGVAGPVDAHDFAGKTDPQIARELLTLAGLPDREIDEGLEALFGRYVQELELELGRAGAAPVVLPGVHELLAGIGARPGNSLLGLLTGNIAAGASVKLAAAGLEDRFRLGVYGSDSENRADLPALALELAHAVSGRRYAGRDVVILGDTPHDMTCGRGVGAFAIGVATGRHRARELLEAGAHVALDSLADTPAALDAIWSGARR